MTYATQTEVQNYIPTGYAIGSGPAPSSAQVLQFLTDTSEEIDAAVASRGLAVPVAAPAWFVSELTRLNALGAAAQCLLLIFPLQPSQPPGGYNSGSMSAGATMYRRYDQRLTEIRKGIGVPVGVVTAENDLQPRSYFTDTNSIGQDMDVQDAWGNEVHSNSKLRMDRVY